jgi:hypothetical protein
VTILAEAFLKNRAEQLPADVSDQFIVPPFFGRISIFADTKSVRILGGRGCGKTMFIRYFCHSTTFSPRKKQIDDVALRSVGLYLRPDTGFCSLMTNSWLGAEESKLAFSHYVTLQLLAEAHQAFVNIAAADLAAGRLDVLHQPISSALALQFSREVTVVADLGNFVDLRLSELELWVRNPRRCEQPMFLSFASVLPRLAEDLAKGLPRLKDLSFRAFIDEFENLAEVQRMIVCDAIKHPGLRLAVHIAHKRDAVTDFKTSSDERIVELHDLRRIDLEEQLSHENEFELLAAELFLLRLHLGGVHFDCTVFDPQKLHDQGHLSYRLSQEYRAAVVGRVRAILPRLTSTEVAQEVMKDEPLKRRLAEMIGKGLARHQLKGEYVAVDLIDPAKPRASVVLGALLNRSIDPAPVLKAFRAITSDKANSDDPFYKSGGWVDNNLYGCLFHLYAGLSQRENLLYAGFERFCHLARPSLRYFQELCHVTLLLAFQQSERNDIEPVSHKHQAQAARQVSDAMFEDVPQLGLYGEKLREMVRRLGTLFEAFNRRAGQSEPEINHFSIDESDKAGLSDGAQQILKEARTWSVLYEEPDTKNKLDYDIAQSDWVLNRIYAPHFGISYRKRRKVTLKAGQVNTILCQSSLLFEALLKDIVEPEQTGQGHTGQLFEGPQ